ncbi:hypothetical protein BH10CYA1_BH10CYA1_00530 [soil metagenome]
MTKEQTVNVDEVTSASKIKLVVTDICSEAHESSVPSAPVEFDASNAIDDPDKVMRELPVDEFFKVLEQSTPEQLQNLIRTFEKGARTKGGTKLLQRVIEVQKEPRSLLSILMWWEMRRPLYNIAVGLAGLPAAFALIVLFGHPLMFVFISALAYMFFANICYSLGTPAELVARTCYKDKAETYGPVLLTLGTIFSVLLTFMIEFAVVALVGLGLLRLF